MKRFLCIVLLFSLAACVQEENPSLPEDTPADEQVEKVGMSKFAVRMLKAVNEVREKGCDCGDQTMPPVPALNWDPRLEEAALRHAKDMNKNNFLKHKGSDGSSMSDRVKEAGYKWRRVGENIASGYPNLGAVMQGWKESAGHCRNMMSADFKDLGAARSGDYWVQNFAR